MSWLGKFFNARKGPIEQVEYPKRSFNYTAGSQVNPDSAMQVSAFYRGTIYISTQIAKLPWNLKDSNNNKIADGTIPYLLGVAPNAEMSSYSFRLTMLQSAIQNGNGYAEIERDILGRPVALWPIPFENVQVMRTSVGKLVYRVMGGGLFGSQPTDVYLNSEDVFHVKNFHTKDGIIGQGVVSYASDVLGISLGADRMAGNLYANGGLPSGTLEVEGVLSDEAYERLKESWKTAHGGRKAGGITILEQGSKFKPVTYSPDILQFLESRQFGVLEMARFLGVPPTKLYDISASSYSNQEQSNLEVATDTLDAWAKAFETEADIKLLKGQFGGRKTEMDLYAIFRGDMTTRANYFSKMMQVAAMTPNEIREKEGMAAYSGGDRFFVAINNFSPSDRIDEIIDAQINKNPTPVEQPSTAVQNPRNELLQEAAIEFLRRK